MKNWMKWVMILVGLWARPEVMGQQAMVDTRDLLKEIANANTAVMTFPLSVDTSGAYAPYDQWAAALTMTNVLRVTNGCLTLQTITLYNAQSNSPALTFYFFSRPFATNTLNSPFKETNFTYCGPPVSIIAADYKNTGTNRVAFKTNLGIPLCSTWTNRNIEVGIMADDTSQMTNYPFVSFGVLY